MGTPFITFGPKMAQECPWSLWGGSRSKPDEGDRLSKVIPKSLFCIARLIPGSQDEAKMIQDEAKMTQDDPKWCQDEVNMAQDGVKRGNESKREKQEGEGARTRKKDKKEQKNNYII